MNGLRIVGGAILGVAILATAVGCSAEPPEEKHEKTTDGLRMQCDVDCGGETFHCDSWDGNTCQTYVSSCGCFVNATTQCPSWSPYLHCNWYGSCYCSTY